MKPLNYQELKKEYTRFVLMFLTTLGTIFLASFLTLCTAREGLHILEQRHAAYNDVFNEQAGFNLKIKNMTDLILSIKRKERTISQHKQLQKVIADEREVLEGLINEKEEIGSEYEIYRELLVLITAIQIENDILKNLTVEYHYNQELLEKCRETYREKNWPSEEEEEK